MRHLSSIVWFRSDLRLEDNPALTAAVARGGAIIPVFIWSPEEEAPWAPGGASRWWLHQSLKALAADLSRLGARLYLRRGPAVEQLLALAQQSGADALFLNRRYEPAAVRQESEAEQAFKSRGLHTEAFSSSLLHEPAKLKNKAGLPFRVFTPFWKTCVQSVVLAPPLRRPSRISGPKVSVPSLNLEELGLEPQHHWTTGIAGAWEPGAKGAAAQLDRFISESFSSYANARNVPSRPGTSRLSPYLHFGEISPRQVWHAVQHAAEVNPAAFPAWERSQFLVELGWREFAHHLLYHFPDTPQAPLRPEFARFRARNAPAKLRAWQQGLTGVPLIDAGMRELWHTGWMHNRVRMVTASFLVKNLLIPWQEGSRWFWDTLVDADLANNTLGWQWTAGCGADAAPFFRVFNPVGQGERFDPSGDYVRRWVPELAGLTPKWLHKPWQAPEAILAAANVRLGSNYPAPMVSLFASRQAALDAYARMKEK